MSESVIEATARRLHYTFLTLTIVGLALAIVAPLVVDVASLYFLEPPAGLPRDVGGFPITYWLFLLIPVALMPALVLQLHPALALSLLLRRPGQRLPPLLRIGVVRSGRHLVWLGLVAALSWVDRTMVGSTVGGVCGVILCVEGLLALLLGRVHREPKTADATRSEQERGRGVDQAWLRRGLAAAAVTLFGFGCFPDARNNLPRDGRDGRRAWREGREGLREMVTQQEEFFRDHGRYARDLSELGWRWEPWERWDVEVVVTEHEEGWSAEVKQRLWAPVAPIAVPADLRCMMWVGRVPVSGVEWEGEPVCVPPAPRTVERVGDLGPAPVLFAEGFVAYFIGVPLVIAGFMLGLTFAVVRPGRR